MTGRESGRYHSCGDCSTCYPSCGGRDTTLAFFLAFLPLVIFAILISAGSWTFSVFVLTVGNVTYKIGAQGYSTTGGDKMSGPRFAYPAPDSWPHAVNGVSLWLLFHFILAILLVVYILMLFVTFILEGGQKREAIVRPEWWSRTPAIILAILVVAIAARDAAFWGAGVQQGDFRPDILGYFVIIGNILLGLGWLYALVASYRYVARQRHTDQDPTYVQKRSSGTRWLWRTRV